MSSFALAVRTALVFAVISPAVSPAQAPPDSTATTEPTSYWGPFPARADSVMARPDTVTRDAWEYPVEAIWWIVRAPFEIVRSGMKVSTVWLDESGTFERLKQLLSPIDLPYGFVFGGSTGRLSGVAGSLGFYHDAFLVEGGRFRVGSVLSTVSNRRVSGGFILPTTHGGAVEVGGGYRVRTRARFFGLGPSSAESDESFFTRELGWAGVGYRQSLGGFDSQVEFDVLWSSIASRRPNLDELDEVALPDRFEGRLPVGYGDESQGLSYDLGLVRNTTQQDGRPRGGGMQMLRASWFVPNDDAESDFIHYRGEVQQFFDLWWDRSIAVRGVWSYLDSDGEPINFQRLMTNDDPDLFRGYEDFRWRDRGLTAVSVEYRYPVWDYRDPGALTLDAYGFYDGGQVFDDRREIALRDLAHSYGFGFRLSVNGRFSGRVEVGFSDEDTVFRLRGDQMFQFGKDGLYHGRDPIPTR